MNSAFVLMNAFQTSMIIPSGHGEKMSRRRIFTGYMDCLELLADNPEMGTKFHEFKRFSYRSHVIYYSVNTEGIRIEQIFHKSESVEDKI